MKNLLIITLLLISNLIVSQNGYYGNEKQIENIEKYNKEEISAEIDNVIKLFGTFLKPKNEFDKILVIISGTGQISQNAHNYLTEYLLENNIAVFRFDKRGVGKSTGTYDDRVETYTNDFIKVFNHFKTLESVQNKRIGFLGHSLGGIVSIQAVEQHIQPDFLIQWSSPIGKPRELIKYQINNGIKNYDNLIIGNTDKDQIKTLDYIFGLIDQNPELSAFELWKIAKKESKKHGINKKAYSNYLRPYNVAFARINTSKNYKEIEFPTLVIVGEKDILVDPKQSEIELTNSGNSNIEFKSIGGLNHFMTQTGVDWKTNEIYNVDLAFKKYIVNWINDRK
jgi:alpha/beta superfamily hydrolase